MTTPALPPVVPPITPVTVVPPANPMTVISTTKTVIPAEGVHMPVSGPRVGSLAIHIDHYVNGALTSSEVR